MATWESTDSRPKRSDRKKARQVLDRALSDGRLSAEEHQRRVSAATNATTLGELGSLVSDLQPSGAPVQISPLGPKSRSAGGGWGMRIAVGVVLVLLGMGLGWGLYGNTSSPLSFTSDPGAKPDGIAPVVLTPPRQLQSLGGLTGLIDQTRKRFGDTMAYRLTVYPDYAVIDRADPSDDRRQLSYTYRGGWGDPTDSAKDSDATLADIAAFDPKAAIGILRGAPQSLNIKQSDVKTTYLILEPSRDPTAAGTVSGSVYVSTDFGSGYIQFDSAGNVKQINYPS